VSGMQKIVSKQRQSDVDAGNWKTAALVSQQRGNPKKRIEVEAKCIREAKDRNDRAVLLGTSYD
jgi:hypothetical protein